MPTRSSALCTFCLRSLELVAAIGERQLHVFVHSEVADQVERLKDESNLTIANARALADGEFADG